MLTEERRAQIVKLVEERKSVYVQELMTLYDASESTIRRDLTELDHKGLLTKVHGGAIALENPIATLDVSVIERANLNKDGKEKIAKYASELINAEDIVFIDAGTTTGIMIDYIATSSAAKATFVTNGLIHGRRLSALGCTVYMPSGQVKDKTEALIGADTCSYLEKMNFTKCFIGSNGVTISQGLTTPDKHEALVKEMAITHSKDKYILADHSKFDTISAVSFAEFKNVKIITDNEIPAKYKKYDNIIITDVKH